MSSTYVQGAEALDPRAQRGLGVLRALQQEAEVAVVTTAEELVEQVQAGAPHIQIRAHLDLSTLPTIDEEPFYGVLLGEIPRTVKIIQVSPMTTPMCRGLPAAACAAISHMIWAHTNLELM